LFGLDLHWGENTSARRLGAMWVWKRAETIETEKKRESDLSACRREGLLVGCGSCLSRRLIRVVVIGIGRHAAHLNRATSISILILVIIWCGGQRRRSKTRATRILGGQLRDVREHAAVVWGTWGEARRGKATAGMDRTDLRASKWHRPRRGQRSSKSPKRPAASTPTARGTPGSQRTLHSEVSVERRAGEAGGRTQAHEKGDQDEEDGEHGDGRVQLLIHRQLVGLLEFRQDPEREQRRGATGDWRGQGAGDLMVEFRER
jgi:hypothetical protein